MNSDFLKAITESFELDDFKPREVAPLILAYIGDAVYEIVVRIITISNGNRSINLINKDTIKFVNAGTQAMLADALAEDLSEEEATQYRRGKNSKPNTKAKNASLTEYKKATGFEALIGYLYLCEKEDRIIELCKLGFDKLKLL